VVFRCLRFDRSVAVIARSPIGLRAPGRLPARLERVF